MKKTISLLIVLTMLAAMFSVTSFAADSFDYAHFKTTGNDPYGYVSLSATIDPDTVHWAVIKYKTITKSDDSGNDLIAQIYTAPRAAEPNCPVTLTHSGKWELTAFDLTTCSKTADNLPTRWTSTTAGAEWNRISFDPIEGARDAEANEGGAKGQVLADSEIDIAFIAFFDSEAKSKAFDGTGTSYAAIIDADALVAMDGAYHLEITKMTENGSAQPSTPAVTPGAATQFTTEAAFNAVTLEFNSASATYGNGFACIKTDAVEDPWVSIPLDVDSGDYPFMVIYYRASGDIFGNNIYLKDATVNAGYSGMEGTWVGPGMTGDGTWQKKTINIAETFAPLADTQLTGIRIPTVGTADGTLDIAYVAFFKTADDAAAFDGSFKSADTSDASVMLIALAAAIAVAGVVVCKKVRV